MEAKKCKKTSDQKKIKNKTVTKKVKSTDTLVTVASETKNSVQIADLNTLRQEALIQLKVEQRLKEFKKLTNQVKLSHCTAVQLKSWFKTKLSGLMNTSSRVRVKRVSYTTNCLQFSGWLAFAVL